jgi:glycerophosphoryl diester phosphodiesterase
VVSHDWTVDCRTYGKSITREHSLAKLKSLDIGYAYPANDKTFPFRGKGVGLMPSLEELLTAFSETQFLIYMKKPRQQRGRGTRRRIGVSSCRAAGATYGVRR